MFAYIKSAAASIASNVSAAAAHAQSQIQHPPVQIGDRTLQIKDLLGEGGFAFVYSCIDQQTGESFALKRMLCQDQESRSIAEKEIDILQKMKGKKYILQMYGWTKKEVQNHAQEYSILLELCTGGSLIDLIKRRNGQKLSELQICDLFIQICRGVEHLHTQSPPIAHRDMKIENVLINSKNELQLCDFGSTTTKRQAYTTQREIVEEEERISKYSTAMYRSPELTEIVSGGAFNKKVMVDEKVDVWALGCILYCLAFFTQPFQDGGNLQILSGSYQLPDVNPFSKYLTALIKRLLTVDPSVRPDITQVLGLCQQWHTFLKGGGSTASSSSSNQVKKLTSSVSAAQVTKLASTSSSSANSKPPSSLSSITDPQHRVIHSRQSSTSTGGSVNSRSSKEKEVKPKKTKEEKEKKAKKSSKHLAAPTATTANPKPDEWADFSSAPPPAAARRTPAPASKPGSDDSSSDFESSSDEEDEAKPEFCARPSMSPPLANQYQQQQRRNNNHTPTASLFDLSSFADTSSSNGVKSASPPPMLSNSRGVSGASASASNHQNNNNNDADWASFDTAFDPVPASSSQQHHHLPPALTIPHSNASSTIRSSKSPISRSQASTSSQTSQNPIDFGLDLDFSGLQIPQQHSAHPATTPTSAGPAASPTNRGASKRNHRHQKQESIDITKLSVSRQTSDSINGNDEPNNMSTTPRIKITLGTPKGSQKPQSSFR